MIFMFNTHLSKKNYYNGNTWCVLYMISIALYVNMLFETYMYMFICFSATHIKIYKIILNYRYYIQRVGLSAGHRPCIK